MVVGITDSIVPADVCLLIDENSFDEEIEQYVELRRSAIHGRDGKAQARLDRWIENVQPKLRAFAQAKGWDFNAEVARVVSSVKSY